MKVGVSYTTFREGEVTRTVAVGGSVMFDLDTDGGVLGAETIGNGDWQAALMRLLMTGNVRILGGIND